MQISPYFLNTTKRSVLHLGLGTFHYPMVEDIVMEVFISEPLGGKNPPSNFLLKIPRHKVNYTINIHIVSRKSACFTSILRF